MQLFRRCVMRNVDGGHVCSLYTSDRQILKAARKRKSYFTGQVGTDTGACSPELGSEIEFLL